MSFAPFKVGEVRRSALRVRPSGEGWDDYWRDEVIAAGLEAAVACAPVIVAGAFELYIAREKARLKLEVERVKAAHRAIEAEGE